MTEDERQRRGLRRYALIDPVVDRPLQRGEKMALLREQASRHQVSLATLKRYCQRFRQRRLEGLQPDRQRADKDQPGLGVDPGGWPYANFGAAADYPWAWYYDNKGTSTTSDDTNSYTWSAAAKLYTFIVLDSSPARGKNAKATPYPGTTSVPYPDNTDIGDTFFYSWNGDGVINHCSIYVANGTDPVSGYSGALIDQHTQNRYHAIWSLSYYNSKRLTTKIYPVFMYHSF